MKLSEKELSDIAANSLTFFERLDNTGLSFIHPDENTFERRIQNWCKASTNGDFNKFMKRLRWDNINYEKVKEILGEAEFIKGASIPAWAKVLSKMFERIGNTPAEKIFNEYSFFNKSKPLPFEHLFIPFVFHGTAELKKNLGDKIDIISDESLSTLQRDLLKTLTEQAVQTLDLEFTIFRVQNESAFDRLLRMVPGNKSDETYRKFILNFYNRDFPIFFKEYPVLARCLSTIVINWIEMISEFINRLYSDIDIIRNKFNQGHKPGKIKSLESGLSDFHNKGRTVIKIEFEFGLKIIYKPKNLNIDKEYFQVLEWINNKNELLPLKVLKVISSEEVKKNYGWMEYVEYSGCDEIEQVKNFYKRIGYALCTVYALEGYDCHYENLIACGEFPVLIDLETMMNPYMEMELEDDDPKVTAIASLQMNNSVIRTGLLPNWTLGKDGGKVDISGLGASEVQKSRVKVFKWKDINTDNMHSGYDFGTVDKKSNTPFLKNGGLIISDNYIEDIITGFREMYNFFLKYKTELLSKVKAWNNIEIRFVNRATRLYGELSRKLKNPVYQRNGLDWSIELDSMSRAAFIVLNKPKEWSFLQDEFENMIRLDVPYYKVNANDTSVYNDFGKIIVKNYLNRKCIDRLVKRLEDLNENEIDLQIGYIRSTFYARSASNTDSPVINSNGIADINDIEPISDNECLYIAKKIASNLDEEAIKSGDGSAIWIALDYLNESEIFQFKPIGYNNHSGSSGIALFLAAFYRVTSEKKYKELSLAAIKTILNDIIKLDHYLIRSIGIGASVGIGSIIYSLTIISELLNDSSLIDYASNAAHSIKKEHISNDKKYDVVFGSAGCILALLKLYGKTKDEIILNTAIQCGDHIIENIKDTEFGKRACSSMDGGIYTGFSHGAAGISYALFRLYDVTKENKFYEAASAELEFEESVFDSEEKNYPDYRAHKEKKFMTSWCHGAPGIGLSRIGMYEIFKDESFIKQAKVAIETTKNFTLEELDHLCCGNFGRIDILIQSAKIFSDDKLFEITRKKAKWLVERYKKNKGFSLMVNVPNKVFSPGLYTGISGIGYALLRIVHPDKLPCILIFE